MATHSVMRGRLRWLTSDEGGRKSPFPCDHYAAVAWVEPGTPADAWSIVVKNIEPNAAECSAEAEWLVWQNVPFEVQPGDVLAIGDGPKVVARLAVEMVARR